MENVTSLLRDTEITFLGESQVNILIFKTNVMHENDVRKIAMAFNEDQRIKKWNIDLEDIDKVLRIESQQLQTKEVMTYLVEAGYYVEELID